MNRTLFVLSLWLATLPAQSAVFRFEPMDDKSLCLYDGQKPVFVYNHGIIQSTNAPPDRARSTYIHPLYGLDGEVLTDDFPKDHYHHRGLFWAWPHVIIEGSQHDLWMLKGIEQRFDRWLKRSAGKSSAVLKAQNYWVAQGRKAMKEVVEITVYPAQNDCRAMDLSFVYTPIGQPVTLRGAEGKSYGGLTLRFAPGSQRLITTSSGIHDKDLPMTPLSWADLTATYPGLEAPRGVAIFVSASHPDYPPTWLTRHYGVLCVGWPGVEGKTLSPGKSVRCKYRVLVHKNTMSGQELQGLYGEYLRNAGR